VYRFGFFPPRLEFVNRAVEGLLGVTAEELYADPELAYRLVDPAHLDEMRSTPTDPREIRPSTWRWRRADGTYAALESVPVPVLDRAGRVVAVEGIARDVTARVNAEEALQRTRHELDTVVGGAPVIVWALDLAGTITLARGAGLAAVGRTSEELVGRRFDDLGSGTSRLRAQFERALRGERLFLDLTLAGRVFATVVEPLRDEAGATSGVIGVSTDVTSERQLEDRAAREQRERAVVELALEGLDPLLGLDAHARAIATELVDLPDVDRVSILGFGPRGLVFVFAAEGLSVPTLTAGVRLPAARARYLRRRAQQGAWVEPWEPREADGSYGLELSRVGITAVAYQPLRTARETRGLMVLSTCQPAGVAALERHLSTYAEVGAIVSARLGPDLREREKSDVLRAEIRAVIAHQHFRVVFQPIVSLDDGLTVAYEALTRFEDGAPPERRFAEAAAVGLSPELEHATLAMALRSASGLPPDLPVTLNVSPALVLEPNGLRALLERCQRSLTLELTEHDQIDDYRGLRAALTSFPDIRWSIDDAGAGFASLRHCVELRPDEIKLDRSLVSGADRDPARLAAIMGLHRFATELGARLVAEGIETDAERSALIAIGVRFGQGYLFGRAASAESWSTSDRGLTSISTARVREGRLA
jgi:PAS domain S-box-containing protein